MAQRAVRAQWILLIVLALLNTQRARAQYDSSVNFAVPITYDSAGFTALSVAVADVNGDRKPDLLVANECGRLYCPPNDGSVAVLLGNGDGTFQAAVSYDSGGSNAYALAVADVNRDGKPDILVTHCESLCGGGTIDGSVSVLMGNGDGTFQAPVSYDTGARFADSIAVADVNWDGKPDLVVANRCSGADCLSNGSVGVLLGNGDGTFQPVVIYSSGGFGAESVAVADLNRDGRLDLVVANRCLSALSCASGNIGVLFGNGDGTFQSPLVTNGTSGGDVSMAVADVNRDRKPDVVLVDALFVRVLLGNGDGTFHAGVAYASSGDSPNPVAIGDMNGDGNLDIGVGNLCTNISCSSSGTGVLLGRGDGTFQTPYVFSSLPYFIFSVAAGDVNGDGRPDIVTTSPCESSYLGCGPGHLNTGVFINTSEAPSFTSLASSRNPSFIGRSVTFTATVTGHSGADFDERPNSGLHCESRDYQYSRCEPLPTGTITFTISGNPPVSVPLSDGRTKFTWTFTNQGSSTVRASYSGDSTYAPGVSAPLSQIVNSVSNE